MKPVIYNNIKFRVIAAISGGVYVLFHAIPFDPFMTLTTMDFYVAFIVSVSISLLLVYLVHRITKKLDQLCEWRARPVERGVLQFSLGVVLVSYIDYLLIGAYFRATGQDIHSLEFFRVDFPVIVFLIFTLNTYYLVYYLVLSEKYIIQQLNEKHHFELQNLRLEFQNNGLEADNAKERENNPGVLVIRHRTLHLRFEVSNDILYFYRSGKVVKCLTSNGNHYTVNLSISDLKERYLSYGFIQISPGMLVNFEIIKGYEPGIKRNTIEISIKEEYKQHIEDAKNELFIVTREYINEFKTAFSSH